jgi:hypothetical protein
MAFDVLERRVGPSKPARIMITDDEITLTMPAREVDRILDANADKAAVRAEHAIHRGAITDLGRRAAEAASCGRTELAAWYRELARQVDAEGAIRLRATAARAS